MLLLAATDVANQTMAATNHHAIHATNPVIHATNPVTHVHNHAIHAHSHATHAAINWLDCNKLKDSQELRLVVPVVLFKKLSSQYPLQKVPQKNHR